MKTLKLREHKSEPRAKIRSKARPASMPAGEQALPLSLIDTQTMRTLQVNVDAGQIAAVRPKSVHTSAPASKPGSLSLVPAEVDTGYDPYNNFGGTAGSCRPRTDLPGPRH